MKLKNNRKKTLIVIGAVVLFLSILLLWFIRQESKEQAQNFQQEEMKKELVETAEYLGELDNIVLRNHETIQSLYGSNGQMQASIDTMDENFVQNMVKQISPIMKKSADIAVSLEEMQSQITNYLHQYGGDSLSQTEFLEQMSKHIENIKLKMEYTQQNLQDLFTKMEKEAEENKDEIKAETAKIQKMIEESNEMLEQFYTSLEELEKHHINLTKNNQTELLAEIKQLQESMSQNMDSVTMDFLNLTKRMQIEMKDVSMQIDVKSEGIQRKLQQIHEKIGQTQSDITNLLNTMEESQSNRMEEVKNIIIEEIKGAVTKTEQALEDAKRELAELVEELKISQDERHMETISVLTDMEDGIQSAMESHVSESLLSLQGSLDAGNSILKENMTNHFEGLNGILVDASKQMNDQFGVLTGALSDNQIKTEQQVTELRKFLQESFDASNSILKENMTNHFEGLNGVLSDASKQMNNQFGGLTDILSDNQIKTEQQITELREFLQESLDAGNSILKENITNHFEGLNGVLSDASKQMNDQFGGLAGTLSDNQIKTEQQITELRKFLLESFDAGNNILRENMLQNFVNLETNVANHTTVISENMTEQFGSLGDTVNQNGQDIKNSMDIWMNSINEKLTEVFQSVSEGKQLIASALTDKGVPAGATESFANLANKIRLITNVNLAGDIKYTYHSHVSGCHGSCGGTMDKIASNAIGDGLWNKIYLCRSCRKEWSTTAHDQPGTRPCEYTVNKCGKTESTIEKAEIIFNSAAMAYDEPIEDFGATVPETENDVLESDEPNTEEEVMDENDAEDNTEQDMGGETGDGAEVEDEMEEMKDETVSGNNADM